MFSLHGTLAHATATLAPALLPHAASVRLERAADALPAGLSRWLYLECRLAAADRRVDLIVDVTREDAGQLLAVADSGRAVWPHVQALARAWCDPAGLLARAVERVWLEFDLEQAAPHDTPPGVFVDLAPGHTCGEAVRRVARLLLGAELPTLEQALTTALAALPPGARIPYLGFFPGRSPAALRVCVAHVAACHLARCLQALRWPGDAPAVQLLIDHLTSSAGAPPPTLLHIDLAPELQPTLGVEHGLQRPAQWRGGLIEAPFLGHLVHAGLASSAKSAALTAWPGHDVLVLPHQLWPSVLLRHVNHVKLQWDAAGRTAAKAYLCAHTAVHPRFASTGRPE